MVFIHYMRVLLVLILVSMMAAAPAVAQTACPTGVAAGSAQCGPTPQSPAGGGRVEQARPEVWVDNWFSYAGCPVTGKHGVAHTFDTMLQARDAALALCRSKGGAQCKTLIVDRNRCFSLAAAQGDDPNLTDGGYIVSDDTLEKAEDRSIGACMRAYPGRQCVVNYSMCNLRERVL